MVFSWLDSVKMCLSSRVQKFHCTLIRKVPEGIIYMAGCTHAEMAGGRDILEKEPWNGCALEQ